MPPETPKGVSSRLLTMKFMQRAAASESAASTPDSNTPSSKKRKLGGMDDDYDLNINSESIQAAIDERDAKRQAALQQHSSNDTHWVLDTNVGKKAKTEKKPMRVLYVGYGDFDSGEEDEPKSRPGRTSTYKTSEGPKSAKQSHEDGGESEDEDASPAAEGRKRKRDSAAATPRARSSQRSNSRQTPESDKAKVFRDQRKKKDVNINRITSISNPGAGSSNNSSMTCFTCQGKGHKASECPQNPQRSKGKR